MATKVRFYEVVDARTDEVLSRHRTRQAALDAWRTKFGGFAVQTRLVGHRPEDRVLIVAGVWHASGREGGERALDPGAR
jgi:hypothetical protein